MSISTHLSTMTRLARYFRGGMYPGWGLFGSMY